MGLMDFLKPADINAGVEEFRATPGARLVDVRTPGEYAGGHIPGAVNVPLQQIGAIASEVPDKSTPLFVYCMSGARSQQAVGGAGTWSAGREQPLLRYEMPQRENSARHGVER